MLRRFNSKELMGLLVSISFLAACSSTPKVQEFAATADPTEEIQSLEKNLEVANSEQVYVLSPKNFKKAQEHLHEAKEARGDNKSNKKVLEHVALGNAWLLKANEVGQKAASTLPGIVEVRNRALESNANIHAKDDLKDADDDLRDITRDFESGDFALDSEDRQDLLNKYMSIELTSIKAEKVGKANSNIEEAVREGAKKTAPKTYSLAIKRLKDADSYITANRQDKAGIDRVSRQAVLESERLLKITRESKLNKNKTPEQLALEMESEKNLQGEISSELDSTRSELGETSTALAVASQESADMSEQVELDEKLKQAKSQFSSSEAEVFRDGDKLLIRLKGLKFPSGQADLTAASYPLMTKVQSVIKSLGTAEIEVQGHTDAIGSRDLNARLSQERAQAVKNYLVENNAIESSNISSTGYADQKPITSNKTPRGREQNRRVDVIITPM